MIPRRFEALCEFCDRPIDIRQRPLYQYQEGWVELRAQGGGHAIALPKRHMRFACALCLEIIRDRQSAQMTLF